MHHCNSDQERTHNFDVTPVIVSPILTPANPESLVPSGVELAGVGFRYTFFFLGECHSVHCQYSFASSGFSSWGAAVRSLKVMNFLCKLNKFLWKPCRPDRKGMRWDSLLFVCVLLSTESDGKWV